MNNIAITFVVALAAILLTLSALNVQADNHNNSNSTKVTDTNHHTDNTHTSSSHPSFHHQIIIVHRTIVSNHQSFTDSTGNNLPIIFVKGVGFVAPINCQLTSNGNQIKCDFASVSVN